MAPGKSYLIDESKSNTDTLGEASNPSCQPKAPGSDNLNSTTLFFQDATVWCTNYKLVTSHWLSYRHWPWEAGDFCVGTFVSAEKNLYVHPYKVSITDENSIFSLLYNQNMPEGPWWHRASGSTLCTLHAGVCVCLYKLLALHMPSESAACPRACVWCRVFTPVCVCVSVRLSLCLSGRLCLLCMTGHFGQRVYANVWVR